MGLTLRAGLAAARGDTRSAPALYDRADEDWQALGLDVQRIMARLDRGRLLGDGGPAAQRELRRLLRRTGAAGLERLADHVAAL